MTDYMDAGFVSDPLLLIPSDISLKCVAISSRAGALVYAAALVGEENNYLRISLRGTSVKYSSFEEFLVHERDRTLDALRGSVEERLAT